MRRHLCCKCNIDSIIHFSKAFGHSLSFKDNVARPSACLAFARSLLYLHICSQQRRFLPKSTNNGRDFSLACGIQGIRSCIPLTSITVDAARRHPR